MRIYVFLILVFWLLLLNLSAKDSSIAPLIFHAEDGFCVQDIAVLNDSSYIFNQINLRDGESISFYYNDIEITLPLYKEIIPSLDSVFFADKILVMSDIEGNFSAFYELLISAGVIDLNADWIFGNGHLAILGDMVDRGEFVDESLLLLYKLEYQAFKNGGRVHYLLGNHEFMLLSGDLRYVHDKYKKLASAYKTTVDSLYNENSLLGRWIRSKKVIMKINKELFVHAGISPELTDLSFSLNEINKLFYDYLNYGKKDERTIFLLKSKGPLWYRGMSVDYRDEKKIDIIVFNQIREFFNVEKIMVGHTVFDKISSEFNSNLIYIDVDHNKSPEALLIEKNEYYIISTDKNKTKLF